MGDRPDRDVSLDERVGTDDATRRRFSPIVTALLFAVLAPVVGLTLVVVAEVASDGRIAYALLRSIDAGDLTAENYLDTGLGNHVDKFGDCLVLGNGLGDRGGSVVERAVTSPTLGSCETAVPRLERFRDTETLDREYAYFRYWHGEAVVVRPAVALFGVTATRSLVAVGLVASTLALALGTGRRWGTGVGLALVGPLVIATDWWDLPESLLHAIAVTTMLGCAAWVVTRGGSVSGRRVTLMAAVSGALFVYVDLLTTPAAAMALVVGLVGLQAHSASRSSRQVLRAQAVAGAAWVAGYAWMWMSKWLIAGAVLGVDRVRRDITDQANLRISGQQDGVTPGLGHATARNLDEWFHRPLALIVTVVVVVLVARVMVGSARSDRVRLGLLALPALIPLVWWEAMSNHSQVHAWFTYRSIAVSLGLLAAAALVVRSPSSGWRGRSSRTSLPRPGSLPARQPSVWTRFWDGFVPTWSTKPSQKQA